MDYGAHLPVIDFGNQGFSLEGLSAYVRTARDLGFKAVSTNDHLIHSRPWLDAPTALAAILSHSGNMAVGTSIVLSVVRGPVQLAKTFAAIDILSNGRLIVGIGPGSSARDYEIVGLNYEERWKRFDEAIQVLRSLWNGDGVGFTGRFYSTVGIDLEPKPLQKPTPPIWIGSWGSDVGLRRVARLGDGWLASAYHITPESFADGLARLHMFLEQVGKEPDDFPHALGTMFLYLTDDQRRTEEVLGGLLSPIMGRPVELMRERVLVGPANECVEKLAKLQAAGVRKVFLWPVADGAVQLAKFHEEVL